MPHDGLVVVDGAERANLLIRPSLVDDQFAASLLERAEVIVAETGAQMTRFPSPAKLAAWAGLAPGDNESAGKRKKAAARKGNQHLRVAMVEAAWAVSRTATCAGARFRRLASASAGST
jgi:transposase